ncbi:DNA polymerase III subunit gamma/tau [Gemella bergeri]
MFQALYRKYRPQNFDDIVGQNHIVSVLKNAIEKNQISHAYLFYGPRGTGKTSIAKIFANVVNKNDIYQKENVDIIEIDAASNNGVDEIRDIKEAIKFLPSEGKYKIYIVDEVHMLTTAAFNALLKTLEEPPAHVIFILATTEIHKIPATILSRCQRFEFKNLTTKQLKDRLIHIANQENLDIEDEAVTKISNLAKGGLRDAISILDQVSNYADKITLENILDVTSSLSEETILEFYKLLLSGDVTKSLLMYNDFLNQAKDTKLILNDLINITRDVIVYKNLKNTDYTGYAVDIISKEIETVPFDYFYRIIQILSETEQFIRFSTEHVSYMQICIVKICSKEIFSTDSNFNPSQNISTTEITNLENRVKQLEDKLLNINFNKTENNMLVEDKEISQENITLQDNSPKEVVIKDKMKIKKLLADANDNFTSYAANVFNKIMDENLSTNNFQVVEMRKVFKSSTLIASSKTGGLLVFNEVDSMIRLTQSTKYKKYLEELFKHYIGVEYTIYALQANQYQSLKNEDNITEQKLVEVTLENTEKTSKIEELFSDIIIEK